MFCTSSGNVVKIWKSDSLAVLKTCQGSTDVKSLTWSASSLAVLSGNCLTVNPHGNEVCHSLEDLQSEILSAEFPHTSDATIGLGLSNGSAVLYDLKRGKVHKKFPSSATQAPVTRIVVLPKETHIAAGHKDGSVIVTSLTTQQSFSPLEKRTSSELVDLQLSPWRRSLLVGLYAAGIVHQWDLNSAGRKLISDIKNLHKGPPTSLALSPINERTALSAGKDKNVEFLDLKENRLVRTIPTSQPLSVIRFYPNGITVIAGSTRGSLFTFDLRKATKPVLEVPDAHNGPITNIVFQPAEHQATRAPLSANGSNKKKIAKPSSAVPGPSNGTEEKKDDIRKGDGMPPSPEEKENTPIPANELKPVETTPVPSVNDSNKASVSSLSDLVKNRLVSDSSVISDSSNVFSPVRHDHSQVLGRIYGGSLGRLSSGSPVFSPVQIASSPLTGYTPTRVLVLNGSDVVSPSIPPPQQRKHSLIDSSRKIEPILEEPTSEVFRSNSGPYEDCVDFLMDGGRSDTTPQSSEITDNVLSTAFPAAFNTKHFTGVVESAVRRVVDEDLSDSRGNVKDLVSEFGYTTMRELITVQMQLEQMERKYDTVVDEMVLLRKEIRNLRKFY